MQFLLAAAAVSSPLIPTATQLTSFASGAANIPPAILMSYPPLALYTNAILTALNALRLLTLASLLQELLVTLEWSLVHGVIMLLVLARSVMEEQSSRSSNAEDAKREDDAVHATGFVHVKVFVQFIWGALVEGYMV